LKKIHSVESANLTSLEDAVIDILFQIFKYPETSIQYYGKHRKVFS